MFKNAKVGDKVFDYIFQEWGEVKEVNGIQEYPLVVRYNTRSSSYTLDGREYIRAKAPVLFWDEVPPIIPPKKPMPKLEVDTKVKVWLDSSSQIHKRYFSHFSENGFIHCFDDGQTSWTTSTTTSWDSWELAED